MMKRIYAPFLILMFTSFFANAQFVQDVVNGIRADSLERKVEELADQKETSINGTLSTIITRVQSNNDLAAEYIKDHFEALNNITINDQSFNAGAGIGRNIIATQTGTVTPNNIYLICAHYDSVATFCADDNATGTSAVLEIARVLSQYETENTIVYALWDQEEIGLRGSNFYAEEASANGDNIVAVVNMDMMGYQNQIANDNNFDIDLRNIGTSVQIKDDLLVLQPTYAPNLVPLVVNPGTPASDHKPFWDEGYGAVLVGESWQTGDQTPFYHSSNDRLSTIDMPYYHEMVKLVAAYTATKAEIVRLLSTDSFTDNELKIFPNPVKSVLNIDTTLNTDFDLEFFDVKGKLIKQVKTDVNTSSIDLSAFSSGVYFLEIKSNEKSRTFKFVKE
ncbi:M28 family peptidase [uncultured Winogradskyella sp.]|uniref:M28 family peptidase n=1 Tax=uncultured Winogradskyella sp. TaxID=395353 RepID=UPI00261F0628|nr:M28 family peptidase [uncultured Winogradskyella sp.]